MKLSDYYYNEKTYNTSTESTLYTPTASKVTDIVFNSDKYEYEVINPEKAEIDGKFDKYTYIIKIKGYDPIPTGVDDNIIPMFIMLMLASVGLVCGLYKKYTQGVKF